jgi:predicted transposase YbfD/YdcC
VVVVRSEVDTKKTGKTTTETRYYLSSQEPGERTPSQWQALVRGHWAGVEIRNHWRRDALWGEDRSRTRNPWALANLALLRNALLSLTPLHFPQLPLKEMFERLHSNPAACLRVIR